MENELYFTCTRSNPIASANLTAFFSSGAASALAAPPPDSCCCLSAAVRAPKLWWRSRRLPPLEALEDTEEEREDWRQKKRVPEKDKKR